MMMSNRSIFTSFFSPATITFISSIEDQLNIKPIYKVFKGWKSSTKGINNFDQLPSNAKIYIKNGMYYMQIPNEPMDVIVRRIR